MDQSDTNETKYPCTAIEIKSLHEPCKLIVVQVLDTVG